MRPLVFHWITYMWLWLGGFHVIGGQFTAEYLTSHCVHQISTNGGGRLEPSTALYYDNNMACTYTVRVPSTNRLLVRLKRFSLEAVLSGSCVDFLNIHDGEDLTAPTLNAEPLCGSQIPRDYVTSGTAVTFHFVTDNSAVYRGFEVVYTAFSDAPCTSSPLLFDCLDGRCIHSDLQCDDVMQCANGQDEQNCDAFRASALALNIPAIIGGCVGSLGFIILVLILYKLIDYCRLRYWLRQHVKGTYPWQQPEVSYPVTPHYTREVLHYSGGRKPTLSAAAAHSRIGPVPTTELSTTGDAWRT